MGRIPLGRMKVIAAKLAKGTPFTCASLASELEVSRLTIHRDIDYMRDFLDYEIEWDATAQAFFGRAPRERVL